MLIRGLLIVIIFCCMFGCMHGKNNKHRLVGEKSTPSLCNRCEKAKPFYINGQWLK